MGKAVLFIPGYPGSELRTKRGKKLFLALSALVPRPDLRLRGPDDLSRQDGVVAGPPIARLARLLVLDLGKRAASLYDVLERLGVEPVKFGWDWRRPVWDRDTRRRLEARVRSLRGPPGAGIVAIVHSTGGLVLRHLLERRPALATRFERVIAFGVPWAGALGPLRFLAGQRGFLTLGKRQTQALVASSWAAFDLLPPDPARTRMRDADGRRLKLILDGRGRQTSPLVRRGWFRRDLAAEMARRAAAADRELGARSASLRLGGRRLPVTNVVGWGARTLVQARIEGSGGRQRITGWKNVADSRDLDGGDGTVPFRSASWLRGEGVTSYHVPVGFLSGARRFPHSSLWRHPGGRSLLRQLLAGEALTPLVYAAVDEDDFRNRDRGRVRVRLSTLGADGRPLTGVRVRATDLVSRPRLEKSFAAGDGRHRLTVPRRRMRRVQGGRLRRFTLRISWSGGAAERVLLVSEIAG